MLAPRSAARPSRRGRGREERDPDVEPRRSGLHGQGPHPAPGWSAAARAAASSARVVLTGRRARGRLRAWVVHAVVSSGRSSGSPAAMTASRAPTARPTAASSTLRAPLTLDIAVTGCASLRAGGRVRSGRGRGAVLHGPTAAGALVRARWFAGAHALPVDLRRRHARPAPNARRPTPTRIRARYRGHARRRRGRHQHASMPHPPLIVVVERLRRGSALRRRRPVRRRSRVPVRAGKRLRPGVRARRLLEGVRHGRLRRAARCAPRPPSRRHPTAALARGRRSVSPRARRARRVPRVSSARRCPTAGATAATPWTRACLPLGAARDVGAPCRDANEVLDADACTTGVCADVGALGVCSASLRRRPRLPRRRRLRGAGGRTAALPARPARRTATARAIRCWPARRATPMSGGPTSPSAHRRAARATPHAPLGPLRPERGSAYAAEQRDRGLIRLRLPRARRRARPGPLPRRPSRQRCRLPRRAFSPAAPTFSRTAPRKRSRSPSPSFRLSPVSAPMASLARPLRFSALPFSSSLFMRAPLRGNLFMGAPGSMKWRRFVGLRPDGRVVTAGEWLNRAHPRFSTRKPRARPAPRWHAGCNDLGA